MISRRQTLALLAGAPMTLMVARATAAAERAVITPVDLRGSLDAGTLGRGTRLRIGTDVEADDRGIGCLGQRDIRFRDGTGT